MKVHMTIFHTDNDDKPFKCSVCSKGYATKVTFLEHSNIHTGERPYQCDMCEKRFSSSGNMYMVSVSSLSKTFKTYLELTAKQLI